MGAAVSQARPAGMDPATHAQGIAELVRSDRLFAELKARNGDPPRWARPAGFASMVLFVLEQQVSLASAKAAFLRLHDELGVIQPAPFLSLSSDELRKMGFSRQKAGYCRGIAQQLLDGDIDFAALADLDDDEARRTLISIRGIGRWTANVFLLFVLGRPDAWPSGDRALHVAMRSSMGLDGTPDAETADAMALRWRPWRGVAAFFLWHDYLGGPAYRDDGVIADILG